MSEQNPYATPDAELRAASLSDPDTRYYTVGTLKLVVMSLVTFSLYQIYWLYKNWVLVKQRLGLDVMPFWRAFFGPLWLYSLAGHIKADAESAGVPAGVAPGPLAVAYFLIGALAYLPSAIWLLSLLAFIPLVWLQTTADRVAQATGGSDPALQRFTAVNWALIVLGVVFMGLAILGTFIESQ